MLDLVILLHAANSFFQYVLPDYSREYLCPLKLVLVLQLIYYFLQKKPPPPPPPLYRTILRLEMDT